MRWFVSLCVDLATNNPLGRSLGWIRNETTQAVIGKWDRNKKSSLTLETLRRSQTWAPSKISNSLFLLLGACLKLSQPIPHCHCQTHTDAHTQTREQMNSHRHQWARSLDETHWSRREHRERMDDSNAAACHAFHTSSLLTIQSSQAPGGLRHWNPVVQPLLPTLGDSMATTHSSTATRVSLFRAENNYIPQTFSQMFSSMPNNYTLICGQLYLFIYSCLSLALKCIKKATRKRETLRSGQFCPVVVQKWYLLLEKKVP